jgi:hypothetical protein
MSMSKVTDGTVQITWQPTDRQPRVDPTDATISTQGKVTWQVSVPAGSTIKIDFAVKSGVKGPFPVSGQPDNPSQGVFEGPSGSIVSAPANVADNTDWKYSVGVYQGTTRVSIVDPTISIRNN